MQSLLWVDVLLPIFPPTNLLSWNKHNSFSIPMQYLPSLFLFFFSLSLFLPLRNKEISGRSTIYVRIYIIHSSPLGQLNSTRLDSTRLDVSCVWLPMHSHTLCTLSLISYADEVCTAQSVITAAKRRIGEIWILLGSTPVSKTPLSISPISVGSKWHVVWRFKSYCVWLTVCGCLCVCVWDCVLSVWLCVLSVCFVCVHECACLCLRLCVFVCLVCVRDTVYVCVCQRRSWVSETVCPCSLSHVSHYLSFSHSS